MGEFGERATLRQRNSALQAAERTRAELANDGLAVRIGIHLGDIDRRGDDVSGLSVHIAARAMAAADPGQIVVTASVPSTVAGQAATFETLGAHKLKGVPGEWKLFQLTDAVSDRS